MLFGEHRRILDFSSSKNRLYVKCWSLSAFTSLSWGAIPRGELKVWLLCTIQLQSAKLQSYLVRNHMWASFAANKRFELNTASCGSFIQVSRFKRLVQKGSRVKTVYRKRWQTCFNWGRGGSSSTFSGTQTAPVLGGKFWPIALRRGTGQGQTYLIWNNSFVPFGTCRMEPVLGF